MSDLIPFSSTKREVPARREDTEPIRALHDQIDRAFENFWRSSRLPVFRLGSGMWLSLAPEIDVRESDKEVEVEVELPGMEEGDIDVAVADGLLTVRAEKKSERDEQEGGYLVRERRAGRFERIVQLPDGLEADSAKATFKNGVLTVTIPKTAEAQATFKRIPVQRD